MKNDIKIALSFLGQALIKHFYPLTLVVLWLVLSASNHLPGTWLSGWDTLHPEFDFGLSFQRLLSGVFRTEQGLGAVAGHSHMSELPRVFLLWLTSFILPVETLRFTFIASCLLSGVLGTYFYIKTILFPDHQSLSTKTCAFLGALFYLLNLGTLQHFIVPFEMFTTLYATLPWLLLTASLYLKTGFQKHLRLFALATLLATPMAFAATLWYAFFLSFLVYLVPFFKAQKKRIAYLLAVTLLINSFWLLPNIYFVLSGNANFVPEARINKIFSEEAFMYNKSYADVVDGVIFKNFLFDWPVYSGQGQFGYLLDMWRKHLNNPWILAIGYLNFAVVVLSGYLIWKQRKAEYYSLLAVACICMIFIINLNPPFDFFFAFIRDNFSLIKESLRFPFTKFSLPLIFSFSCLFALGQDVIYQSIKSFTHRSVISIQLLITTLALVIFMWPAFEGQFISPTMQVQIPNQYFQLFDWLKTKPADDRVAILPINSMWGWVYYKWGFQGAQFVSFGIKQPLLDRDYDRWNKNNEDYYNQMSYAIYSQNPQLVNNLIQKYHIHYLITDESIIDPSPGQDQKSLYLNEIKSLFAQMNNVKPVQQFNDLTVYEVQNSQEQNYVSVPENIILANGPAESGSIDWVYQDHQDYITSNDPQVLTQFSQYIYPFRYVQDNQNIVDTKLLSVNDNQQLVLHFPQSLKNSQVPLENYLAHETSIPADFSLTDKDIQLNLKSPLTPANQSSVLNYQLPFQLTNDINNWIMNVGENQTISLNKPETIFLNTNLITNIGFYHVDKTPQSLDLSQFPVQLCSQPVSDQITASNRINDHAVELIAKNVQSCIKIPFSRFITADQLTAYQNLLSFHFQSSSSTGSQAHYCVYDHLLNRCIKEKKYLPNPTEINEYVTLAPSDIDTLELVIYVDGIANNHTEKIIYQDFNYSITTPAGFISITPDEIYNKLNGQYLTLTDPKNVTLNYQTSNLIDQVSIFEQGHTSNSCSSVLPKQFDRTVDPHGFIEYSSLQGSSCDYFSFPNLVHNSGYLLEVESQNISGLPLRLCIANNTTKRCDLYLSLKDDQNSQQFQKHILLIPPTNDGGAGYDIHLDNYSVGTISSVNRLRNLKISPFPYQWVSRMEFKAPGESQTTNNVVVSSVHQISPFIIRVDYQNPQDHAGVVEFNQSYDSGWWVFNKPHVQVNGWANGWVISPHQSGFFLIIYWPEFLELFGLFNTIALFAYLYRLSLYELLNTKKLYQPKVAAAWNYLLISLKPQ